MTLTSNFLQELVLQLVKDQTSALDLSGQDLKYIQSFSPISIRKLQLKQLYLNNNQFSSIPNFQPLIYLEHLNLSNNKLGVITSLPFPRLKFLDLSCNQISHISIKIPEHLQVLNLENNLISNESDIEAVLALQNLTDLNLIGNPVYNQIKTKLDQSSDKQLFENSIANFPVVPDSPNNEIRENHSILKQPKYDQDRFQKADLAVQQSQPNISMDNQQPSMTNDGQQHQITAQKQVNYTIQIPEQREKEPQNQNIELIHKTYEQLIRALEAQQLASFPKPEIQNTLPAVRRQHFQVLYQNQLLTRQQAKLQKQNAKSLNAIEALTKKHEVQQLQTDEQISRLESQAISQQQKNDKQAKQLLNYKQAIETIKSQIRNFALSRKEMVDLMESLGELDLRITGVAKKIQKVQKNYRISVANAQKTATKTQSVQATNTTAKQIALQTDFEPFYRNAEVQCVIVETVRATQDLKQVDKTAIIEQQELDIYKSVNIYEFKQRPKPLKVPQNVFSRPIPRTPVVPLCTPDSIHAKQISKQDYGMYDQLDISQLVTTKKPSQDSVNYNSVTEIINRYVPKEQRSFGRLDSNFFDPSFRQLIPTSKV